MIGKDPVDQKGVAHSMSDSIQYPSNHHRSTTRSAHLHDSNSQTLTGRRGAKLSISMSRPSTKAVVMSIEGRVRIVYE